ncbi:class I SAM-dependent methyltransferase [uncultured Thiodictyon sp.]|uniref:class I SAM-dependent methyltransferase n=1 Tax=uncultured Thiodictyon sp. TaxID=1846217 RepID=UPI0025CD9452|nr:class I SAM-dependent methyltransferase [uncultured Thiodictyon sp.]
MNSLESHYTAFWLKRLGVHFYPSEFLVRTFLSQNCPNLKIKHDYESKNVLDLGCGDGRNMGLLANLGMNIYGTEITQEICEAVTLRMEKFGIKADIRMGRNSSLPFKDQLFDYVVASASVYYVDSGTTFEDNMREIQRVLKPGGHIVFSMVHPDSYILIGAETLADSHFRITNDPLGLRNGYVFKVFQARSNITDYFSKSFLEISIGYTSDDYYGLKQDLWLLVAKKRELS